MTISKCRYLHLDNGDTIIICEYEDNRENPLRCVKTEDLKVDPSVFIGLKYNAGIDLDVTKQPVIKKKLNLVSLFDDEVEEEIKENVQLGLF